MNYLKNLGLILLGAALVVGTAIPSYKLGYTVGRITGKVEKLIPSIPRPPFFPRPDRGDTGEALDPESLGATMEKLEQLEQEIEHANGESESGEPGDAGAQ